MNKYYYVYIVANLYGRGIYIGYTNNLETKIKEHNAGLYRVTKSLIPMKLLYFEGYINKFDARRKVKFLKSQDGESFLQNQLKRTLEEDL